LKKEITCAADISNNRYRMNFSLLLLLLFFICFEIKMF